jgi:glutaredoxin-related protein
VFKIKYNEYDNIQKHKVIIVAKGYSQQPEVDFSEPLHLLQEWKLSK